MSLAELSIRRPIFITCVILLTIVAGLISLNRLSVDLFPDVTFPVVVVNTQYSGAGPVEIETQVTKPIEDELSTISGLKKLTSKSLEGVSQVMCEFNIGADIQYAEQQVRDKVAFVKFKLPKEIDEPTIRRIDPADMPILNLALNVDQPGLSTGQLYRIADHIVKSEIQRVSNVGLVEVFGGRKREIQVLLDRKKLKDRELSVTLVAGQLGLSGENIPAGKIKEGEHETLFRSMGEFRTLSDISESIVSFYGNEVSTKIADIGRVEDGLEDEKTRAFLNGKPGLFISVYRQSGSNTVSVVRAVKALLPKIEEGLKARGLSARLSVLQDGAWQIKANIDDVEESILIGIILTMGVVYLFLGNFRATMITGFALPNSMIGAFILMALAGFSINVVTLIALVLCVGLLVDDAIVVRESIFKKMEQGMDPMIAATQGTREVQLAVIATTCVVVAVFGPVAFTAGIVGQFLKSFGLTIVFAMLISLFDALTVAPMLSAYFPPKIQSSAHISWARKIQDQLDSGYEAMLKTVVYWPKTVVTVAVVIFIGSMGLARSIPSTFIPSGDQGEFVVYMDLPVGTHIDAMTQTALKIDTVIRQNPEIELTSLAVGNQNGEVNKASVYVHLKPFQLRSGVTTTDLKLRIRDQLKPYKMCNPKVQDYDPVGSGKTRHFSLILTGNNDQSLEKHAARVLAALKQEPRLADLDSTYRPGRPEFLIEPWLEKMQALGVSTRLLGSELRAQVEGLTPAKFRQDGEEYVIRTRIQENERNVREHFNSVYVPNVNQRLIRVADFAEGKVWLGPSTIDRQDRARFIEISADIAPGASLGKVIEDVEHRLKTGDLTLPDDVQFFYAGSSQDFKEMGDSLLMAFGFALIFIYFVLASLYESFITPLTIMLAIPLAIVGAFVALFLANESLNLLVFLGIFMLVGVASKNSILLVDCAKQFIDEQGMDRVHAVILAGKMRLRPILMTSLALIAGAIPLAMGLNEASRQRTGMGFAIMGGVVSSTVLTLIVIPAVFIVVDVFRVRFETTFRRIAQGQ
jgi:HAE1 family hydrophobic/amphiphilic exporter-1